tara:strand:+ start:123 stop:596 length:474 start_codon:yes stop_codon:yes gene_type:complete
MKSSTTFTLIIYWHVAILLLILNLEIHADTLSFKFKSPSFSGLNTSSHYLTIDSQEASRKQAIKDDIEALKNEIEREENNTVESRFMRNLTSRIYAQLSRQMVESLFGEDKKESGSLTLEGNKIEYEVIENETITLTITDESGGTTTITVPIGDFTF